MPELRLTRAQAQRLWNLTPEVCAAALSLLISAGALRRADDGTYLRGTIRTIARSPRSAMTVPADHEPAASSLVTMSPVNMSSNT